MNQFDLWKKQADHLVLILEELKGLRADLKAREAPPPPSLVVESSATPAMPVTHSKPPVKASKLPKPHRR